MTNELHPKGVKEDNFDEPPSKVLIIVRGYFDNRIDLKPLEITYSEYLSKLK